MNHQYRKKPVVIEAFQTTRRHIRLIEDWPDWLADAWNLHQDQPGALFPNPDGDLFIRTLGGPLAVSPNDWIIRGVKGELYPCKPDIFAATYDPVGSPTTLNFGQALELLKAGKRVARQGWNGKGMWLCYIHPGNAMHLGYDMQPCIGMKTSDNKMQPGWLASQTDMLSEDWVEIS